jgi:hypothetical protein
LVFQKLKVLLHEFETFERFVKWSYPFSMTCKLLQTIDHVIGTWLTLSLLIEDLLLM